MSCLFDLEFFGGIYLLKQVNTRMQGSQSIFTVDFSHFLIKHREWWQNSWWNIFSFL